MGFFGVFGKKYFFSFFPIFGGGLWGRGQNFWDFFPIFFSKKSGLGVF